MLMKDAGKAGGRLRPFLSGKTNHRARNERVLYQDLSKGDKNLQGLGHRRSLVMGLKSVTNGWQQEIGGQHAEDWADW